MVATYLLILKHVGFSKINTETCQKGKQFNPVVQSGEQIHPPQLNFIITENFDNANCLTSPQNISFDLQAIIQLK